MVDVRSEQRKVKKDTVKVYERIGEIDEGVD
jgi:hypothetical protein